jgi:outer membrane lipoprotein-sorting protein
MDCGLLCALGYLVALRVFPTMKALIQTNSTGLPLLAALRRVVAVAVVAGTSLSLTGCLSLTIRHRTVGKTVRAPIIMDATLEQLNQRIAEQYAAVKTLSASVDIKASVGGSLVGEVKEYPAFAGFILLRKPSDLRVFMLVPVFRSLAMDMVSDGKDFKLYLPQSKPDPKAVVGSDREVAEPSKNGLDNLRPYIIRDALLIPPVQPGEFVSLTQGARILPPAPGKKEATEEPDYDLTITRPKTGNELETIRVIHVGRATLKPYEQDVYDHAGRLVTVVTYDKYQKFGDLSFPTSILISRPLDQYTLQITVDKLTLNQPLDDEQFVLKIPDNVPITKM